MSDAVGIENDRSSALADARDRPKSRFIHRHLSELGGPADALSGLICGIITILYGISYAALIFSGPLAPGLSFGLAATFLTTAVAALIVSMRSSIPFMISGPDSSTSAVTAALSGALAHHMIADGGAALVGPAVLIIAMGSLLSGLFLFGLGRARAGRAIRFVPYPVIGGFLGATGLLLVEGSVQVMTGHKLTLTNIGELTTQQNPFMILAGLVIAATLFWARSRFKGALTIPAVLAGAVILFYAVLALGSVPISDAQQAGWTFASQTSVGINIPWTAQALTTFPWASMPSLLGNMLAVVFVTTISTLLNTAGIELTAEREADLDQELKALGVANLVSGALGGYVSCMSLSRTTLAYSAGARGRLAGMSVAVIAALMLIVDPAFLSFIPKSVLGGLLLFMGLDLLYKWLVQSSRRLMLVDYLSLLAIVAVIFFWGFVYGVLFGIVTGCATFAFSASRVNAIKFSFDGGSYRSLLDRSKRDLVVLNDNGSNIQGMALQSYLYFGSANSLYQHIKQLIAKKTGCRFLVFDFRLVTGIDSSAIHSFNQIKLLAGKNNASLVLVNMSNDVRKAFKVGGLLGDDVILSNDLHHALESCENVIIEDKIENAHQRETFIEWLEMALQNREYAQTLAEHCKKIDVAEGALIARQGAPSDSMHFIMEGRIGVVVSVGPHSQIRVRSLGQHTTIGEMGLLTQQPRSADIVAEANSLLYELSAESYDRITSEHPALTQALLTYVMTVMSERLRFANQTIGILQN